MTRSRDPRALFLSLEGIDGAGKSSHLEAIEALLRAQGRTVTRTREPGGTPLAEQLRELILKVHPKLADHLVNQAMTSTPSVEDEGRGEDDDRGDRRRRDRDRDRDRGDRDRDRGDRGDRDRRD